MTGRTLFLVAPQTVSFIQQVDREVYAYDDNDAIQNLIAYASLFTGTVIPVLLALPRLLDEFYELHSHYYKTHGKVNVLTSCKSCAQALE